MKESRSSANKIASTLEREICEILGNIQNSFYSAVNIFTALERKHNEIVGTIKPGQEERDCGILQIEQGFCVGTKDKKHPGIKRFDNKHLILFDIWGTALIICGNSTETPGKAILLAKTYSPSI